MGNINEKNTSLVQERIKRHGKRDVVQQPRVIPKAAPVSLSATLPRSQKKEIRGHTGHEESSTDSTAGGVPQEFSLDTHFVQPARAPVIKLESLGLASTEIEDDVEADTTPETPATSLAPTSSIPSPSSIASQGVPAMVKNITAANPTIAVAGLKAAESTLKKNPGSIIPHADELLSACSTQLDLLFSQHFVSAAGNGNTTEPVRLCKHLIGFVLQVFKNESFSKSVSPETLQNTVEALLNHVQDPQVSCLTTRIAFCSKLLF